MNVNGAVRADMLRTNTIGQNPAMLGMGNAPFIQNPAQMAQQQLGPNSMPLPTGINSNPPMSMLPSNSQLSNVQQNQRMFIQHQQQQQQQLPHGQQAQRPMMRQGPVPQQMLPAANSPAGAHMAALNPQMQNVGFPTTNIVNQQQLAAQNSGLRRVPSQTHLNPGNMNTAVTGGMSIMNPQQPMPPHMQQQMRTQHQHQRMPTTSRQGGPMMTSGMPNASSSQNPIMNSLPQPASMAAQSHPMGLPQNSFPNGIGMPNQQSQLRSSSPRPNQMPPHPNAIGMATPGPSRTPVNRTSMTPDNSNPMNFMNYSSGQFPVAGGMAPRMTSATGQYPFPVPSTPPMDMAESPPSGMMNQQINAQPRPGFLTPAQQLQMNNPAGMNNSASDPYGQHFGMAPPGPPRPPSHPPLNSHPMQQHTPQMQHQQSPQSTSQIQNHSQNAAHHPSPLQSGPSSEHVGMHPSRPHSRPRSQPQHHTQTMLPHNQTPRSSQIPLPPSAGGIIPPPPQATRLPPHNQQRQQTPVAAMGPQPPPHPMLQPQLTGSQQQQHQPPQQGQVQGQQQQPHPALGPRQPLPNSIVLPPNVPPVQAHPGAPGALSVQAVNRPNQYASVIGSGQGLIRLLQFSGILSGENKNKLQLSFWNDLVKEYFTPKAIMKFTLWKDNQKNEAKPFEIGLPILPRFFLVTTQSGVKSMTLALDGARERMYAQGHAIVECVAAVWTYKYTNGYTVTLRGPLTAHVVVTAASPPNAQQPPNQAGYMLKFEEFEFDATHHDKYISIDSILGERTFESPSPRQRLTATPTPGNAIAAQQQQQREEQRQFEEPRVIIDRAVIPGEPVNAFGIPQATMRCLELAESVGAMAELITYANETKLGPLDALSRFAVKLREGGAVLHPPNAVPPHPMVNGGLPNNPAPPSFQPFVHQNGLPPQNAPVTLYSSAPPSVTNPTPNHQQQIIPPPPQAMQSPQNPPSSASNSPQKQHKVIPQSAASGSSQTSAAAASPTVSSGATNTPSLSNASLKRKQTADTASPTTTSTDQPPPKRATRKRNRTTGGG